MKLFGTVESYDNNSGHGFIKPEVAGKPVGFERSAFTWADKTAPSIGRRLSYELSETSGTTQAINLNNA